ncbi:MAG: hypothetical protein QNJ47_07905 [Nostocaceae cyanobacterium]|nr:hypothetical protein [Nostocaceae cyanobacterium]
MQHLLFLRHWQIPLFGSLLILGAVAHQGKPVLSNQKKIQRIYTYLVSDSNDSEDTLLSPTNNSTMVFSPPDSSELAPSLRKWIKSRQEAAQAYLSNDLETAQETEVNKTLAPNIYKSGTKTAATRGNVPQQDGVYLYSQSSQPNQLGKGYIVLERRQGKVIGGLYMPQSEFNCFQGTVNNSGKLAMTVQGFSGDISLARLVTVSTTPKLPDNKPITYAHSITLTDYHQIDALSANDRHILQMCKTYQ